MPNLSSIFLGSLPSEQRKFLRTMLEYLRTEQGIEKVIIPCVGQFGAAKCAIEAGFRGDQIECSDISLFSSLLGYYYMGQPVEHLDFWLEKGEHREMFEKLENDKQRVAFLMLLMKVAQLRPFVYYEKSFIREIWSDPVKYREQLERQLEEHAAPYKGIKYEQKDLRDYFYKDELPPNSVVIMNPPAFAKGYEKMFGFGEYIGYGYTVPEFNFGAEYMNLFYHSKTLPPVFLWHTSKDVSLFPVEDVIFAKQYSIDKYGHWMITDPDLLGGFPDKYMVVMKKSSADQITKFKMMSADKELTESCQISIKEINKETALYYRDLFAHRLGSTVAEIYYAIFVDGELMSVCGFNTSFLRRLQETYIFENFCFSIAHNRYENLNRLSMMCLVSGQFKEYLQKVTLKNSAYVDLQTFRTVCLTKYRKSKLNNGLLKLVSSERVPENDTYKLVYEQPFYMDRTYKTCLSIFLTKDVRYKKNVQIQTESDI